MPTAIHAVAAVHDTPFSSMWCAPGIAGVGRLDQPLPFHETAVAETMSKPPATAMHATADAHDTALSGSLAGVV